MVAIQGSMLSKIINRIIDSLIKGIDDLVSEGDWDIKEKDINENDSLGTEIIYTRKTWPNGEDVTTTDENILIMQWILPVEGELSDGFVKELAKNKNLWEEATNLVVTMNYKDKDIAKEKDISLKEVSKLYDKMKKQYSIDAEATQIIIRQYISNNTNINSAKSMKMSLTKVSGGKEIAISLNKITANYDLTEAINDVDSIISDDTFVQSLPENTETCYEVLHEDLEYDVNVCEDFSVSSIISDVMTESLKTQLELKLISLTCKGPQYDEIVTLCDPLCYNIDNILRCLSDTLIVDENYMYSPELIILPENYTTERNIFEIINMKMQTYLDLIDAVYINCDKGIQSQLDYAIQDIQNLLRRSKRRSN